MFKYFRKEVLEKINVWSEIWNRKFGIKKIKGEKKREGSYKLFVLI